MPILNVKMACRSLRNDEIHFRSVAGSHHPHPQEKPEVTSIAIDYVAPDDWIVEGETLAELGKKSVYFDIKITDETNTKAEKAEYIDAAFRGFSQLLGELHEVSYVHIQDVRATAYGYGGRTQEHRYHFPN